MEHTASTATLAVACHLDGSRLVKALGVNSVTVQSNNGEGVSASPTLTPSLTASRSALASPSASGWFLRCDCFVFKYACCFAAV